MNLAELRKFKPQIMELASQYGVSEIFVFGSVARGDADENSDVDLLVNLKPKTSLFDLIEFQQKLEDFLHKKIDIGQVGAIKNPIRLARITREQVAL